MAIGNFQKLDKWEDTLINVSQNLKFGPNIGLNVPTPFIVV